MEKFKHFFTKKHTITAILVIFISVSAFLLYQNQKSNLTVTAKGDQTFADTTVLSKEDQLSKLEQYNMEFDAILLDETQKDKLELEKVQKQYSDLLARVQTDVSSFDESNLKTYQEIETKISNQVSKIDELKKVMEPTESITEIKDPAIDPETDPETDPVIASSTPTPNTPSTTSSNSNTNSTTVKPPVVKAPVATPPVVAPVVTPPVVKPPVVKPPVVKPPTVAYPAYGTTKTSLPSAVNGVWGWEHGKLTYTWNVNEMGSYWAGPFYHGSAIPYDAWASYALPLLSKPSNPGTAGQTVTKDVWVWLQK